MNTLILPQVVEDALHRVNPATTRRNFLRASGALVVTASLGTAPGGKVLAQALARGRYPDPDFLQLDTWIVIHPDNTATFYVGKTDGGQGTGTAFRQMMCDELDIAYDQTRLVMGITDITPDQGGSGGSDGVERDGQVMRRVAAEARRVLLDLASERLNTPVIDLTVRDGLISVQGNPSRAVTYAELVGGKRFDVALSGDNVDRTTGIATVKPQNELRVIGQSIPRYDTPAKVDGSLTWAVDVKVPGMLHARNVRPPVAGATLKSIDESSVAGMPGFVRVVSKGNYVAVVCEREEQAINAARALKAQWQPPAQAPFPASNDVFDFIRTQSPAVSRDAETIGEPAAALASAATRVEAQYDVPFQGHTAIGPAHAMADPSDGQLTIYSNDMKSYGLRNGVAEFLGLPREQVRVVYMDGPQVYGRTAADDAGFEAAYLAHELGRPVRVQWMRDEETAWDTKGPAYTFTLRGGLDEQGKVVALDYEARALDFNHLWYNDPNTVLIAQLMGRRSPQAAPGSAEVPSRQYGVANQRMQAHIVSLPLIWETPLRTGNLRDPNGPQVTFAFESFIDELAAAAHADPVQFRLDMIEASTEDAIFRKARSLATVRAAARAYGWESRPSPNPRLRDTAGAVVSGRGIAYTYRSGTIVAVIAEVDVNRETGHVWVKRLVCAHDCGLVVNPTGPSTRLSAACCTV
ncbi:MAG: xanthine dehydrogenase family protein molybdopterin-binding subunit [Gammaproteobacteria bacterium]|nr:xanthine dehydrogenase family protein molybdopterin-binding subunit [Gammaproteobacteria bacterium]